MVVIPLKAQFVSLIITIVLVISEFLTHQFLMATSSFSESRRLRRGEHIRIRNHLIRSHLIALLSVLMFVALEVVVSNFSDPIQTPVLQRQSCFVVDGLNKVRGRQDLDARVDVIESQCASADKTSFIQMAANLSRTSSAISCSQVPLFKVQFAWLAEPVFLSGAGGVLECESDFCMLVVKQQNLTFFSVPIPKNQERFATDPEFETLFSPTEVFYDTQPFLRDIAKRALKALSNPEGPAPISDPYELRRRMFSGTRQDECEFDVDKKDETVIATAVLALIVSVFVISGLCYFSCLGFWKKRFAHLSDPIQLASRTFRPGDEEHVVIKDPIVKTRQAEDGFVFVVFDS